MLVANINTKKSHKNFIEDSYYCVGCTICKQLSWFLNEPGKGSGEEKFENQSEHVDPNIQLLLHPINTCVDIILSFFCLIVNMKMHATVSHSSR